MNYGDTVAPLPRLGEGDGVRVVFAGLRDGPEVYGGQGASQGDRGARSVGEYCIVEGSESRSRDRLFDISGILPAEILPHP